jgi:mevalonate kinase
VILLGEHAVVYGAPAIAAGLERGVTADAEPNPSPVVEIGVKRLVPDDDVASQAFDALLSTLAAPPMRVRLDVAIPLGTGLGGSAAIGVAIARAVVGALDPPPAETAEARVLAAADAWERVFHGNPSGIDVRAAALGGCIWYTREGGPVPLRLTRDLELAVAIAGPAASTRDMVASVERLKARSPAVDKTIAGIDSLVHNARTCIELGHLPDLGKLMDLNQMLLAGLFVSTEEIERACRLAREAGALGAKLTGAGGGGAVIALVNGDAGAVLSAWEARGIEGFSARIAAAPQAAP